MIFAVLKSIFVNTPLQRYAQAIRNKVAFKDAENSLIYIHIGKCGGATLWKAIRKSPAINTRFKHVERIHVSKPPILRKASYVIIIRNPIKRALSAFNWRYKLVVADEVQKHRFYGEHKILKKYGTLNALAENLYDNGVLNKAAAKDFRRIFHLKQDIAYYIGDLLDRVKGEQIYAVFATETLNEDIKASLGVSNDAWLHEYSSQTSSEKKHLSELAYSHLRLFFSEDYAAIEKLLSLKRSTHASADALLA